MYPPVAARLRSNTSMYDELSQIWALATLVGQNGQVVGVQLSGRTADSAHPINCNSSSHSNGRSSPRDQAYFYFPDLAINTPGQYRIRITLMRMSDDYESPGGEGVAVAEAYVDSRSIVVEEGDIHPARPSELLEEFRRVLLMRKGSREREFLRLLRHDGQDVPSPN
jgi:hypothetical protein